MAHWVAWQWNLFSPGNDQFLALWGKMVMKCPSYHGQIYDPEGTLPTENWHLPSISVRIKSWATAAADLQHPLKGVQGGDQERGTLCSGEDGQNRPSEDFVSPNSCIFSYPEKH